MSSKENKSVVSKGSKAHAKSNQSKYSDATGGEVDIIAKVESNVVTDEKDQEEERKESQALSAEHKLSKGDE